MKSLKKISLNLGLSLASLSAQPLATSIESDPIAFALKGFSLHLLLENKEWRGDLGIFGLSLPEAMLPKSNDEVLFRGMGIKVDRFLSESWFVGIQGSINQINSKEKDSEKTDKNLAYETSIRGGYRWLLGEHFYIQPWMSIGYQDFITDKNTPELSRLAVFPTFHLGWRF